MMVPSVHDAPAVAIRKLDALASLDDADRSAVRALPHGHVSARTGQFLVQQGEPADTCYLLLSGHACRHKLTGDGNRRQIVSFHIPGDILDLQHLWLSLADHNLLAITDVTVATFASDVLRDLALARPRVGAAMWRETLIEASVAREWLLNVGRRDARSRIAHVLCEFLTRRHAAGLGPPEHYELPMTQEQLADATGLTPVHVNRMLSALETDGLIERRRGKVEIIDWARICAMADFDPAYLHLAA